MKIKVAFNSKIPKTQNVESYSQELKETANKLLKTQNDKPLGIGTQNEEILQIEKYKFIWDTQPLPPNKNLENNVDNNVNIGNRKKEPRWTVEIGDATVYFNPKCSINDAVFWLNSFKKISNKLSNVTLINQNLIFEVGMPAEELGISCLGMASGNHIMFPLGANNCNLLCVWAEKSGKELNLPPQEKAQITLEKMILHEIGHTLKNHPTLCELRKTLNKEIFTGFYDLHEIIQEVSPQYLNKRFHSTSLNFQICNNTYGRKREETQQDTKNISGEVFAEVIRHYYLEPHLTKIAKPPPKKVTIVSPILSFLIETLHNEKIYFPKPKEPEQNQIL
jgi:hypothetical protein